MSDNSYNVANVSDLFALQKGFIEDVADPKESGRVRVRLINKEFRSGDGGQFIPVPETQYLPWATVLMPADNAGGTGTSGSGHNLKRGDIVWASLINGDSKQRLVIGVQNAVAGSSKENPATEYQALQRYLTQDAEAGDQPNPASHVGGDQPDKNPNLGSKQIGATADEDESRQVSAISTPASNGNQAGTFSVTVADGKCATDPGSKIENILGEFFATLQHTNGNIGSYYISKYTGGIFELQSIAQGYITRVQAVVSAAISRAFGELMVQIKKGIQALIKALLAPLPGVLKPVVDWFTQMLEKMGCTMENLIDRMSDFVEGILLGYIGDIVSFAACQAKRFVDAILGRVLSEMSGIINTVFGGLSSVLGAIGSAVDVVGGGLSSIMNLLGISCSGNAACKSGPKKKDSKIGGFEGLKAGYNDLDELLAALETGNHLPIDSYCADALTEPEHTTEVNVWGPQVPNSSGGGDTDSDGLDGDGVGTGDGTGPGTGTGIGFEDITNAICSARTIRVDDIPETSGVPEGSIAEIKVRRNGDISTSNSFNYYTIDGTAKANEDYCPVSGFLGFGVGEVEKTIQVRTISDNVQEGNKYFFLKIKTDGCGDVPKDVGKIWILDNNILLGDPTVPNLDTGGGITGSASILDFDTPVYLLTADKTVVYEGQEVTFNLQTNNVEDGTTINYTIGRESTGITFADISYVVEDGKRSYVTGPADMGRQFTVIDNQASVTIALLDDGVVEDTNEVAEQIFVELNGLGVAAGCAVLDPVATGVLDPNAKSVSVAADKVAVEEGESVTFTVTTTNFQDGERLNYTLFGSQITQSDILEPLEGTVYIEGNRGELVVNVLEDNERELAENLSFTINDYAATATIVIRADVDQQPDIIFDGDDDDDDGLPVLDTPVIDGDGGIIDIAVLKSGRRYRAKPFISIEDNARGFGAYIEPILNSEGYLTRVKVVRPGQGYAGKPKPTNVVCQLVGFAITNVGGLYTSAPTVYVNGDSSIAKATISDEGFVNGIVLIKGGQNYLELPEVIITGGGGFGAYAKPDLQCVPEEQSELILQGLARDPANYVDCP